MSDYRRSKEGRTFFFIVVTHERRSILTTERGREFLRAAIFETRKDRPFQITAIVLLPDHLHTVWMLPSGDSDYSTRWRQIKSSFTRAWLASGGTGGALSSRCEKRGEQGSGNVVSSNTKSRVMPI